MQIKVCQLFINLLTRKTVGLLLVPAFIYIYKYVVYIDTCSYFIYIYMHVCVLTRSLVSDSLCPFGL